MIYQKKCFWFVVAVAIAISGIIRGSHIFIPIAISVGPSMQPTLPLFSVAWLRREPIKEGELIGFYAPHSSKRLIKRVAIIQSTSSTVWYWMVGDNRESSRDSYSSFGWVSQKDIIGKVTWAFPLKKGPWTVSREFLPTIPPPDKGWISQQIFNDLRHHPVGEATLWSFEELRLRGTAKLGKGDVVRLKGGNINSVADIENSRSSVKYNPQSRIVEFWTVLKIKQRTVDYVQAFHSQMRHGFQPVAMKQLS